MKIELCKSADAWIEGLPLGNGISAAMIWGKPPKTTLSLNHVDFWRDNLKKDIGDYSDVVKTVKRLIMQGNVKQANDLYHEKLNMKVMPRDFQQCHDFAGYTNSFQPVGNIIIEIENVGEITGYRRTLDLEKGIANISYESRGNRIYQEYFVSAKENVIIGRIRSSILLSGRLFFDRPIQKEYVWQSCFVKNKLYVDGSFDEGVKSSIIASLRVRDGIRNHDSKKMSFIDTEDIQVIIALDAGKSCLDSKQLEQKLLAVSDKTYETLHKEHCQEHGGIFNRVKLKIGTESNSLGETAKLISKVEENDYKCELVELVFQMGRYLMMSCNRAGRRPANLQGIWNNQVEPMWDSDWHFDMNIEMSHWLNNPANLDECNLALFKQVESFVESGKLIARKVADCEGVLFYGVAGSDGMMWTEQGGMWTGAAAWICQHFWSHYEFTLDKDFLRNRAYPFLKQVGLFYKDFLVKNGSNKYVTGISHSPENVPPNGCVMNEHCTMDTALVRDVMRHLLQAGEILGNDKELRSVWQDIYENILGYPIAETGELKEWPEPLEEQPCHRHFSHLYPLFPGDEITKESTQQLFEAARKAVYKREEQGLAYNFGWSYPYLACLHARLGEGNKALENLKYLAQSVTLDNLLTCGTDWRDRGLTVNWKFNTAKLFQIEAGLGATAAIAEMLLQSHGNIIKLLPALPAAWSSGEFKGLKARGTFEIDAEWKNGRMCKVGVRGQVDNICKILCCADWDEVEIYQDGKFMQRAANYSDCIILSTIKGKYYAFEFS